MKKLLLALLLALAPTAFASTWYVDGVHGSDSNDCKTRQTACKTIGHAISLASSRDTIGVGPATYKENLTINISLKIIGADARTTIVDGNHSGTVFTVSAPANISRLTIQNGRGDGIRSSDTLILSRCIVTGNTGSGSGIDNEGTLTVSMCTITGNSFTGGYNGGITNNEGRLTVKRSTITGNSGGGYSGGILNLEGTATVNNSTITGNSFIGGSSGGIANLEGTTTINNSTITRNSFTGGNSGGIANLEGVATTLQNTITANNSPWNCYSTVTSGGYNLSDDDSCNFNGPGDMNNTEPLLGTLGNNGGPTQTIPELAGSPTIDAGNPTGCRNSNGALLGMDQRHYPRPGKYKNDKRCDIGAYESQTD